MIIISLFLVLILLFIVIIPIIIMLLIPIILMFLIPLMIVLAMLTPILMILSLFPGSHMNDPTSAVRELFLLFVAIVPIVKVFYFSFMESSKWMGSIGKRILGMKVTDLDGNRLSLGRAFGRNLAKILSAITSFIGFIMALFNKKKRTLHDFIAKTVVVKKSNPKIIKVEKINIYESINVAESITVSERSNTQEEINISTSTDTYVSTKEKKPQKTWVTVGFIILATILTGLVLGFSSQSPVEPVPESVPVPVAVDLTTGTWTCGVDIEPGSYIATPVVGDETGSIEIDGSTDVYETLGDAFYAVQSVTFTIEEGDTIEISGLSVVRFEPFVEGENIDSGTPVPVDLATGIWICGVDIAPGRYTVTPVEVDEVGSIGVDGSVEVYETIGDEFYAEPSVTFTIEEGDTIEIINLSAAHFEPCVESEDLSSAKPVPVDLTAGVWTCGVDVAPGRYTATAVETDESGSFEIDGSTDVDETLGNESYAVPSVTFTIKEGDTIEVSGMSAVHLEPVE